MSLYEKSKKPDEFFLITQLAARRIAYPVALAARWLGLSPNAVTICGGLTWVISIPVTVFGGYLYGLGQYDGAWGLLLLAAFLWNAGFVLDVADGSLARMNGTSSASGYYLDFVFHMIFNPMFLAAIGAALHLATGHLVYLVLGLLSICANWGASYAAKNHVVCEAVAKGMLHPDKMTVHERKGLFLNCLDAQKTAGQSIGGLRLVRYLVQELLLFPGQFTSFGVAAVVDFILWLNGQTGLPCMRSLFLVVSAIAIMRVPFRVKREFRSMCGHDHMFDSSGDGA